MSSRGGRPHDGSPRGGGLRDGSAGAEAVARLGGRVRVRVGALLLDDAAERVLLVEHDGLWPDADGTARPFWAPPGGGVEFGESLAEALVREVREETGLAVTAGPVRYVLDFVRPPLHAVSFYLSCALAPGQRAAAARLGADPEMGPAQILRDVAWVELDRLAELRLYPEGLDARLPADARAGFPEGTRYLGTFR